VTAALIGLIGALVGVIAGALISEWREQRREKRILRGEVRAAARLVGQELQALYARVLASERSPVNVTTPEWGEHRSVLAGAMDDRGWDAVASAYAGLEFVAAGHELTTDARGHVRRAQEQLRALVRLSRDDSWEEDVLQSYEEHLEELLQRQRALARERRPDEDAKEVRREGRNDPAGSG